jgi:hypothetical protein
MRRSPESVRSGADRYPGAREGATCSDVLPGWVGKRLPSISKTSTRPAAAGVTSTPAISVVNSIDSDNTMDVARRVPAIAPVERLRGRQAARFI